MLSSFSDLRAQIKGIEFNLLRNDQGSYFEGVILKEHLSKLILCFEKFFGPGAQASKLPKQYGDVLDQLGGVWPGQSLYFLASDSGVLIALLWPWSNGFCATVKIIESAVN